MAADADKPTSRADMREGKEKTQLSRLKKLRRRISASFGRLSISKEETIHESDNELDYVFQADVSTNNGYYPQKTRSAPDTPPAANGNHTVTNGNHRYDAYTVHTAGTKQVVVPRNPEGRHTPVKRHHSAGDMLGGAVFPPAPKSVASEKQPRPKSEGHVYSRQSIYKRAVSFGGPSAFGRADSYSKLEQLGEGSYATVFKGFSSLTNQVVALKEIRLQEEEGAPFTAIREASLLKGLRHANIVTLHDIIHTRETLTFVFEYVHTDLSQYLERHPGGLNTTNVKLFSYQLLRGLAFCHQRRILHRDLKPQNLLISEIGELKLADFGLARAKSIPSHTYSHEVVTLWYRPPDVLLGSTEYSTSLDMWGVGCILTEMISGQATFPGMKDAFDQLNQIFKMLGTPTEASWEGVTKYANYDLKKLERYPPQSLACCIPKLSFVPHAEELAAQCLQMQPHLRISAAAAKRHDYFKDLPSKIHELSDTTSIFNIPGLRLLPETGDVSTTQRRQSSRSGIRTTLKI
ncbi:cyclin-dependent kinase 14-like isoform X1 [Biomphalaria glabrata]|uniref:cyclin-dependent kinase n=1 Tax=Biomphalaria glabrata TaxID=6526 RepID=A0A9U8EG35_BIOGL|nr:cyclin-dependent kinase 14-like isoform X1 [Biomphalaria glabrata]KAI8775852.1 cyclin-dependent kinase 14 isoform X1 [Biomphalaria glabrata]